MLRNALGNFRVTLNSTKNAAREITRLMPWIIAIAAVILSLSIGNHAVEAQTDATVEDYTKWELPTETKARLGKGGINAMQFSPDGTQLAVGSNIGVWLYDVETGKELSCLQACAKHSHFHPMTLSCRTVVE